MLPAALAAFVAGVFILQQQASLPARAFLVGLALLAIIFGGLAYQARRRKEMSSGSGLAAAVLLAASSAAGFAYAGWRAHERLDVALAPADEGREIGVVGVVARLPAKLERGVRFEFAV